METIWHRLLAKTDGRWYLFSPPPPPLDVMLYLTGYGAAYAAAAIGGPNIAAFVLTPGSANESAPGYPSNLQYSAALQVESASLASGEAQSSVPLVKSASSPAAASPASSDDELQQQLLTSVLAAQGSDSSSVNVALAVSLGVGMLLALLAGTGTPRDFPGAGVGSGNIQDKLEEMGHSAPSNAAQHCDGL
ncbi:hypothetical protein QBZ16_004499 [Prototheca wickerhamii]|uniref:Uncharacterized protein n=1 Tax=Prototheca wickerhamii TaxID=3111 RepID=A0AAD9IHG2_PROWI|nr:hypothetical protein QBZ16_004499 [Prototheca wickerhamii]